MGSGSFTRDSFIAYNTISHKMYDAVTNRVVNQTYTARKLDKSLNPKNVIRECLNTEEHPNTIPVILALDVTGSMGNACKECAESLGNIIETLYEKFTDIEFLVMGIGDLDYDNAPIQASQFESDVRIASSLDKIYMEHGGGGNSFESYTAAWYFGLHHTKLDCFDKQGRKGIIITMGDEPLNPYLPVKELNGVLGDKVQDDVKTSELYKEASKMYDIFHIAVDDKDDSYRHFASKIKSSFSKVIGEERLKVSTIQQLPQTICDCIEASVNATVVENSSNNSDGIAW